MQAPVPTPDITQRPDGVTSKTDVAQALTELGGLPYRLTGTISTTTNGAKSVETIDPESRTLSVVDGAGRTSAWTFDSGGRVTSQSMPGSPTASFTYDGNGREASATVGTGSTARTTTYAYDPQSGAVTETRADGSKVALVVDAQGNVTNAAAADGSTTVGTYDATGRLTQVQPAGGLSFTMGYSAAGRSTLFLPPAVGSDTAAERTTYDADGLPTTISQLDGQTMNVTYDGSGRPASWTVGDGAATVAYDPTTGLEAKSTDPGGATTAYAYAGDSPAGLTWTGPVRGSVTDSFDANGRVSTDTIDGAAGDTWTYDGAGSLTGIDGLALTRDPATGLVTGSTLGVVGTSTSSNDLDQLVGSTATAAGTVLLDDQYTRDALGRIISIAEKTTAGTTTTSYTYDGSDRLSSVTVNGKVMERDTYDAAGDRISTTSPAGTVLATYDARDRLETWGARTYTWTANGTLASMASPAASMSFDYDAMGNLRSVKLSTGETINYVVDADGRRIGRGVGGSLEAGYLYDPSGRVAAETDGSGAIVARFAYDDAGHLALVTKGNKTYRVIVDQVGSPRLVIDSATGAVAEAIDYDAWGRVMHDSAPGFMPVGFAGGLVDPDTGLVHFGARDYDPGTGRWTSSDPARFGSSDSNLYRYAGDDSINHQDPTGLGWSCEGANCKGPGNISCTRGACGSNNNGGWGCVVNGACSGPNGGCFNGTCGGGPTGFHCHAEMCYGPDRQECHDCNMDWGDAHILTADGTHYDFQAAGEFVEFRLVGSDARGPVSSAADPRWHAGHVQHGRCRTGRW